MQTFRPSIVSRFFVSVTAIMAITVMTDAARAQMRLGGSQPAVLSPRPTTPVQSSGRGARQPNKPALDMTLVDPRPIGAETTTNIYFAQVAVGGGYSKRRFSILMPGIRRIPTTVVSDRDSRAPSSTKLR